MILVDTGILYALVDRDDRWHKRVKDYLGSNSEALFVPVTVLPEICYLLNTYLGQSVEQRFVNSLVQGEIRVENLTNEDFRRALNLLERYSDLNIGFVDASLVAIAERFKVSRLLTTDRRHFSVIRPHHISHFELLP